MVPLDPNYAKKSRWLRILRRAASAGRRSILTNYNPNARSEVVRQGASGDKTLRIDAVSESAIYKSLTRDLGKNSFVFLSEEMGEVKTGDERPKPVVVCDPLDGSHNAQVGIPLFSISLSVLGLQRKIKSSDVRRLSDVDVALIASVPTNNEFTAIKGRGSFHGRIRLWRDLQNVGHDRINTLGIECGDVDYLNGLVKNLSSKTVYKIRVLGSAAMSLALLAEGTLDGLIFAQPSGARTIDSHAGFLIAIEAGCLLSDMRGELRDLGEIEVSLSSRINIVGGGTKRIHDELIELVNSRKTAGT